MGAILITLSVGFWSLEALESDLLSWLVAIGIVLMSTLYVFLPVLAVGGSICGVMWYFSRRLIQQSWPWRAVFCMLVGVTIAPTFFIFESIVVLPAVIMLRAVFDGGKDALWCFFVFGVLPILCTGGMIFALWSVIIWRRQRRSATPQP